MRFFHARLRSRPHSFQLVNRTPSIRPEWRDQRHAYFAGICQNLSCKLLIAGGVADRVHLFVSMDATHSIAEMVNALKSNSSHDGPSGPATCQHLQPPASLRVLANGT